MHWGFFILLGVLGVKADTGQCPQGQYQGPEGCATCQPGYACNGTASVRCEQGYFQPFQGMVDCFPCPSGYHQPEPGKSFCIPCPLGHFCNSTIFALLCAPGFYQPNEAQSSCIPCPSGSFQSTSGGSFCLPCPAGHFCPLGSNTSTPCRPGSMAPDPNSGFCIQCPNGQYTTHYGSTSCEDCPDGHECSNNKAPFLCPPGTARRLQGGIYLCESCSSGYYQVHSGQNSCQACPLGFSCSNAAEPPVPCSSGQYQDTVAQSSCKGCPSGTYQPNNGSSFCYTCPVGHVCTSGTITPCDVGNYNTWTGGTSCVPCPAGTYADTKGSSSCKQCSKGHYCPSGSSSQTVCPKGTFQTQPGQGYCSKCLRGHFCPSPILVQSACVPGFYQDEEAATSCTKCPDGTFTLSNSSVSCFSCPQGHMCPRSDQAPIPCPSGSIQAENGQSSCQQCNSGFYQLNTGQLACVACPADHACPNPKSGPVSCPSGYFQPSSGQSECIPFGSISGPTVLPTGTCPTGQYRLQTPLNNFYCQICPPGHRCPDGATAPIPCPTGQYMDLPEQGDCNDCAIGTFQNQIGSFKCDPCPQGYNCSVKGIFSAPKPCDRGSYWNSNSWSCSECSSGYYANNYGQTGCTQCPPGHYCPTKTDLPIPCPAGKYQSYSGATSCNDCGNNQYTTQQVQTQCQSCPNGFQCSNKIEPVPCSLGQYSNYYGCTDCGSGYYQDQPAGLSNCFPCGKGHYCPNRNNAYPIPCPSGTYQDSETGSYCNQCSAGYECPTGYEQIPCPTGTFSAGGNSSCQLCPTGQYTTVQGSSSCTTCPQGHKCLVATDQPIPCPPGTYQNNYGQTTCKACGLGNYQLSYGYSNCNPSPSGTFWRGEAIAPEPCAIGTYQSSTGQSECILAGPGYYVPATGQSGASWSPEGYFAPGYGNTRSYACPAGSCTYCGTKTACTPCTPNPNCPHRTGQQYSNQACPGNPTDPGWSCAKKEAVCAANAALNYATDGAWGAATSIVDASEFVGTEINNQLEASREKLNSQNSQLQEKDNNPESYGRPAIEEPNIEDIKRFGECYETMKDLADLGDSTLSNNPDWGSTAHEALSGILHGVGCIGKEIPIIRKIPGVDCLLDLFDPDCRAAIGKAVSAVGHAIAEGFRKVFGGPFRAIRSSQLITSNSADAIISNWMGYRQPLIQLSQDHYDLMRMLRAVKDDPSCYQTILDFTDNSSGDGLRTISPNEQETIISQCSNDFPENSMRPALADLNMTFTRLKNNYQQSGTILESIFIGFTAASEVYDPTFVLNDNEISAYLTSLSNITRIQPSVWTSLPISQPLFNFFAIMPSVPDDFQGISVLNLTDFQQAIGGNCADIVDVKSAPSNAPLANASWVIDNYGSNFVTGEMFNSIRPMFMVVCTNGTTPSPPPTTPTPAPTPCDSSPCQNYGTCTNLNSTSYSCNCDAPFFGNQCENTLVRDCHDILQVFPEQSHDGVHTIYINGNPVQVYCDMRNGGYTYVQRRLSTDSSTSFNEMWADYKAGFGSSTGSYWIGLENMHALTAERDQFLTVELSGCDGESAFQQYQYFKIANESSNYKLSYTSACGSQKAGDSFNTGVPFYNQNGASFSTPDRDNDDASWTNCAEYFRAGWWYPYCPIITANLNGEFNSACRNQESGFGILWKTWKGDSYSCLSAAMKIMPQANSRCN